jgi:5'-nucleotidase
VAAVVRRYEEEAAARSAETIATLSEPLPKVFAGGSRLGRLIADAQRAAVGADVAIMNNGGIRAELPGGPINYGDLFRVQPFQNTLIRLRLRGGLLLAALEHSLSERGLMANVSGLIVEYDPDEPRGARVRCARLADGRYVRRDSTYTVVVNNFMAAGGSGYWMFKKATEAEQTGIVDLDALVTFLKGQAGPVEAPPEARWIVRAGAPAGCG